MNRVESRTGKSQSFWSGLWPMIILIALACLILVLFARSVGAQEQTAGTQYLPALFVGTQPGSHSFQAWISVSNLGNSAQTVTVSFFGDSGAPVPIALSETPNGVANAQATWGLVANKGEVRKYYVVSNPVPLLIVWAKILNPSPPTIFVAGRYQLYGPAGLTDPRGFAFFQAISVVGKEWTYSPLELAKSAGFSQRTVPFFVDNPGASTVSCTATLKDGTNASLGLPQSFAIASNGLYFSIFDVTSVQEKARAEIVCSDNVITVAAPFLNDQFTALLPQAGRYVALPNQTPQASLEGPPSVVTRPSATVSGWFFDPDGEPYSDVTAEVSLNGGVPKVVTATLSRVDVQNAYGLPSSAKLGFTSDIAGLRDGRQTVDLKVTDRLGAFLSVSRNFTVNLPAAIVPENGKYEGWTDDAQSTPTGTRIFWEMTIEGGQITFLLPHFTMICGGVEKRTSALIVGSSSYLKTLPIVNGSFVIGPRLCDYLVGEFANPTSAKITYSRSSQGTCWGPGMGDCPSISTFAPNVVKVR